MRKAREIVAHVEPAQAFGVMGVGLRTIVLGMLEGQGVAVDLLRPAVGLVGHRAAAAPAEETPDPGRGGIDGWRLAGEAEGAARHAEKGGDRRGGIAYDTPEVTVGAPVLRPVKHVADPHPETTP